MLDFCYLGIYLSRKGKYNTAKKHLAEQAAKALYGVLRKIRYFDLPIYCQLDLFEKVINPVLLYSCEVRGYENLDVVEREHLKFLKLILNFKSSTPSYMVYGETGRYRLSIFVKIRMAIYWGKILTDHESKHTSVIYWYFYKCYTEDSFVLYPWIKCVGDILYSCGLFYVWINQNFRTVNVNRLV